MITEDQSDVVRFLSSPSSDDGASVEQIETHSAVVFLAGQRAYKLKRAVRFDYLDFSTSDRRRLMCEAELRLNQRTAPKLYRRVIPVTREQNGALALGGAGTPVDWVLEMNRFPQEALFDRLAAAGQLDLALMPSLGAAVAAFHATAERRPDHGGVAGMAWVIDGNASGFAEHGTGVLDPEACRQLTDAQRAELDARATTLEERRTSGFVRQCHGDLHLRNIVLLDGRPTLFDAIEFDDRIACIDVLYDLAFLLMDLWRRRLTRHANAVWNGYLAETNDLTGISLMPLFLSCRAAVRAKTSATAARLQSDPKRRDEQQALAREYLAMARELLDSGRSHPEQRRRAFIVAIGGFSGTGKSTLALGLAPSVGPVPGAVVIRTDEIRKRLLGMAPLQRLGPEGYTQEVSARVYAAAGERAKAAIREGHSAIVDAVFACPEERQAIERIAAEASVPFAGIWLEAPEPALIARVEQRRNDASDADADVIRMQSGQPTGVITWQRIDASASAAVVLERASEFVNARLDDSQNVESSDTEAT
jgi:aminoglycoside phosphotransferase family enzyme/predicted kinase